MSSPKLSFCCSSPQGSPVEVEVGWKDVIIHFADHAEALSFDPISGDLNAIRHYFREGMRIGDSGLKSRLAVFLGQLASPWTTMLLETMGSTDAQVRSSVLSALCVSRYTFQGSAIDHLADLARNDDIWFVRNGAAEALMHFGGAEPGGDVLLGARCGRFRHLATEALIEAEALDAERVAEAERVIEDPAYSEGRKTAARELLPQDEYEQKHNDLAIGSRIGVLRDTAAVRPMLEILRGTRTGRPRAAVAALGLLRDARAVPELISTLRTGSPRIRAEAAEALGEICDPRAIPPLAVAMRKGGFELRLRATQAMMGFAKEYREPSCLEPLILRLTDLPDIRLAAAWGLNFLNDPRAFEPLLDALFLPDLESPMTYFNSDLPSTAQQSIAAALAGLDDERAADHFMRLLDMERGSGRVEAIVGLVRLRDPRVLPYWNQARHWISHGVTIAGQSYKCNDLRDQIVQALREMGAGQRWPSGDWALDDIASHQ